MTAEELASAKAEAEKSLIAIANYRATREQWENVFNADLDTPRSLSREEIAADDAMRLAEDELPDTTDESFPRLVLALLAEVTRLKRGDFTPEEFQNLCHHKDEVPGCTPLDFMRGCAEYAESLFGQPGKDVAAETGEQP